MKVLEILKHTDVCLNIDLSKEPDEKVEKRKIMEVYKLVQSLNSACDKNGNEVKKLKEKNVILEKIEAITLFTDDIKLTNESKKKLKRQILNALFTLLCDEYRDDIDELLFFTGALLNLENFKTIIKLSNKEEINQTRFSDSVLIFILKYGDITNEDFFECVKVLTEAEIDVNKCDMSGRFAIDYVAILYKNSENNKVQEELKKVAHLLLECKICKPHDSNTILFITNELNFNLKQYTFAQMNIKSRLFFWLSTANIKEFTKFRKIRKYANCDNGESTILQFCINKCIMPLVEILLKNDADPNLTTQINPITPLELAARSNCDGIFKALLNCNRTKITEEQFNNFVKWRGRTMKRELFGLVLESDKLDPTYIFRNTGNTPLHYAIRLCHKKAIQKLLKRQDVCLTSTNFAGKCPLDILNPSDLQTFLDTCIIFDNRKTIDFNSAEYKMELRFQRLTDGAVTEVDVINMAGKYPHLEHILAHPLIHFYIMLKWFKVKCYFWSILSIHAFLFLLLSVLYYRYPHSSPREHTICFILTFVHIFLKCVLCAKNFNLKQNGLHKFCEISLIVTFICGFFFKEFRAFVFVQMAIVFLLIAGYHPQLSHWSVMLQTVFRTFTKLLIFFSLLMVAFAAAFHIMFEDHRFFTALYRSIFMSYFMTIGEINVSEVDFETTPFGGYLLFFLFAMSMSVVIINFWTGVAIKDIDKFEKRSEVKALKNVVAFVDFVERHIYCYEILRKVLPNPLLFPDKNSKHVLDFYINKDDQFEPKYMYMRDGETDVPVKPKKNLPYQIDRVCLDKIRQLFYRQQTTGIEQKILGKLEQILKILEIQNHSKITPKILKRQNTML